MYTCSIRENCIGESEIRLAVPPLRFGMELFMAMTELKPDELLHQQKASVSTIDIVLKGSIIAEDAHTKVTLSTGSLIGSFETGSSAYRFGYKAASEASVFSYDCHSESLSEKELENVIRLNPKLSLHFVTSAVRDAAGLFREYLRIRQEAVSELEAIRGDHGRFRDMCERTGKKYAGFPEVDALREVPEDVLSPAWEIRYMNKLSERSAEVSRGFFMLDPEFPASTTLLLIRVMGRILKAIGEVEEYHDGIKAAAKDLRYSLRTAEAELNGDSGEEQPDFENSLDVIMTCGGMEQEFVEEYQGYVNTWKALKDKNALTDEMRILRKNLTQGFYKLYEKVFYRSLEPEPVPPEAKMFLYFGYIDKALAGEENTNFLYQFVKSYEPDPEGHVFTMYEWLKQIHSLKVNPSKSTMDCDYFEDLAGKVRQGEVSQKEALRMKNDRAARVSYEIRNLFESAHKQAAGRITTFIPFFDRDYILKPLGKSLLTVEKLMGALEKVKKVDPTCLCRSAVTSFPQYKINQFIYHPEVIPHFILMPVVGSRTTLWQEVDGKVRTTPARMICPIFSTEDVDDAMVSLIGAFRWEMCKREQGMRWNDVRDPSLTSRYNDYLQFFKKNSELSPETREKIKTDLKRARNNFRNMFVFDYIAYIKYESSGSPRLNKVAREILFEFCPFGRQFRESLSTVPQYQRLIEKYNNKAQAALKVLENDARKIEQAGAKSRPPEVEWEIGIWNS